MLGSVFCCGFVSSVVQGNPCFSNEHLNGTDNASLGSLLLLVVLRMQ